MAASSSPPSETAPGGTPGRGTHRRPASGPGAALRETERRARAAFNDRRRSLAAGPPPDDAEVQRMVAEFHARGGEVTRCATVHLLPVHNGAGRDARRWTR
ncbi:hypothetical protein GCM10010964_16140 [Caldovatus sediminis]|jgi:hypothetical protein|uniref:Uncharacterized protein n=1 Tax=Caldovatus sediminis TaxID=2041189 RepID=A0A8J2ZAJ9_9PROT|nr:hypothetical protein GCM10010964_16140 [Caldovatus sediminis]